MHVVKGHVDEQRHAGVVRLDVLGDLPAVELARESDLMAEVLGADLLELLIQQSEREIEFIANQVTPVEIERYLENF